MVRDRAEGTSSFYKLSNGSMKPDARRLWSLVSESTTDPLLEQDRQRLREVIRNRGESWADSVAGGMERHYSPGRTWEAAARGLLGLARLGDVLDVASGDGALAELVAPRAESVTCLDISPRVIAAAQRRLSVLANVRFRLADMHALPFRDACFDEVLLMNALTYAHTPALVLQEAARVLRPGGTLVGTTLRTHRHRAVAEAYGHVRMGFAPAALKRLADAAGLDVEFCGITCREPRAPHFEVVALYATRNGEVR